MHNIHCKARFAIMETYMYMYVHISIAVCTEATDIDPNKVATKKLKQVIAVY